MAHTAEAAQGLSCSHSLPCALHTQHSQRPPRPPCRTEPTGRGHEAVLKCHCPGERPLPPCWNSSLPMFLPLCCHSVWLPWPRWCTCGCSHTLSLVLQLAQELGALQRGLRDSLGKETALRLLPLLLLSRKLFHSG